MKLFQLSAPFLLLASVAEAMVGFYYYRQAIGSDLSKLEWGVDPRRFLSLIEQAKSSQLGLTFKLCKLTETFDNAFEVLEELRRFQFDLPSDPATFDLYLSSYFLSLHTSSLKTDYLVQYCLESDDMCGMPEGPLFALKTSTSKATEEAMKAYLTLEQDIFPRYGLSVIDPLEFCP